MRRWNLVMVLAIAAILFLVAGAIQAGTDVEDIIELNSPEYESRKKGSVQFSHKKHMEDYAEKAPELNEGGCGACHHDDQGKPLASLKMGDEVQRCIECHKEPGEFPRKKGKKKGARKKVSKAEKLEYHAEALHGNCRDCHKAFNKKTKTKAAPTTCTKCHQKKKK